jgi:hypothetical protein
LLPQPSLQSHASRIIQASRERFTELGIFPEDVDVPIGIVELLWSKTGRLEQIDTEDLINELYGLSLLLGLDLERRTFRIHDTIRQFVREQVGRDRLLTKHKHLLMAVDGIGDAQVADVLTRRYFYLYRPYHLAEADERQKLDALLLDPRWLKAKLAATGTTAALVTDYDQYARSEAQSLIGRVLRLTSGICTRDPHQLMPQLLGRLMAVQSVRSSGFLEAAHREVSAPAILMRSLSLTPPGAEIARLECDERVDALCVLPDGRLASGNDGTIRLWDPKTGSETARFGCTNGSNRYACCPTGALRRASMAILSNCGTR